MKKALSIVLSVAMLLTVACSMFVVPASAAESSISFLGAEFEEGAENVTVNADGSITATGKFSIAPNVTFDYTTYQYIEFVIESDIDVMVTMLDRDPLYNDGAADTNGDGNGYGEHWITFENEWTAQNGGYFTPENGLISFTGTQGGLASIYNWLTDPSHGDYCNWTNTGEATARLIVFEPREAGTFTVKKIGVSDGTATYYFDAEPAFETTNTYDLAIKDVDMWEQVPTNGSRVTFNVDGDTLMLGNTAGSWPCAYVDFAEPIAVDPETAMIYADFSVAKGAKTTMYLFLGNTTATEFDSGAYVVVHDVFGAEVGGGTYQGYITLADLLPEGTSYDACFNEDGALLVTAVKLFATSEGEGAIDPAVTIRSLDLLYNEFVPEPTIEPGDVTGDGIVDMVDAFQVFNAASSGNASEAILAAGDMNSDGIVDMMDAFAVFKIASGS